MNLTQSKYSQFGLVRDMLATAGFIAKFDLEQGAVTATEIAARGRLLLTGEGSSRIFPAKNAINLARRGDWPLVLHTEAGRQAQEYNLDQWAVLAASNSGKTSELIKLFQNLKARGHGGLYGLTATPNSKLAELARQTYVLSCGGESAVAATKSVLEQALFVHNLIARASGQRIEPAQVQQLARDLEQAMTAKIEPELVAKVAQAGVIYFAGRNDGVGEELTLKTNEITRKKSDFLEGTYAVHGIEEVMNADDVVICIDPYPDSEQKFQEVLGKGVGLTVIAIAARQTSFPTIVVPQSSLQSYVMMAAGWNLLVEIGVQLGINLDKPMRARKVGNEFVG